MAEGGTVIVWQPPQRNAPLLLGNHLLSWGTILLGRWITVNYCNACCHVFNLLSHIRQSTVTCLPSAIIAVYSKLSTLLRCGLKISPPFYFDILLQTDNNNNNDNNNSSKYLNYNYTATIITTDYNNNNNHSYYICYTHFLMVSYLTQFILYGLPKCDPLYKKIEIKCMF